MDVNTVYVQKAGGEFINETAFSMATGCRLLGLHVETFESSSFDHVQITKEDVVHGYVGTVLKALRSLGVKEPIPRVDGLPPPGLLPFYGRNIWTTTMGEIRKAWDDEKHFFIKPLNVHKAFTGHVTSSSVHNLIQTASMPNDFEVLCSDVVDFVVEYRLFVHHGLIIDCRRYRGDFTQLIDFRVAEECVKSYANSPVAYSLDLGITSEGKTLVVEVNDAFSLGGYGTASIPYAEMVIDRWEEMVSQ